jgi:hypothetical protein
VAALKATTAVLSDSDAVRDIAEATTDMAAGSTIPVEALDEVMRAGHHSAS